MNAAVRFLAPDPGGLDEGLGLVFDDAPLESILYGAPGPVPSSASLYGPAKAAVAAIEAALDRGETLRALELMVELVAGDTPVPDPVLVAFVGFLGTFIPNCPSPLVEEHEVPYERILKPCFDSGVAHHNPLLVHSAGTALYRWHEGCGRYREAAEVVGVLLYHAHQGGYALDEAVLTNNLGYEYMRMERWAEAAPLFRRSIAQFERLGDADEVANVRANVLLCEAGMGGVECLVAKKDELEELAARLSEYRDWRVRKPWILLARTYEFEGVWLKALRYAHRAVRAGRGVPTRHHLEDREYMDALRARCVGRFPRHAGRR